MTEPLGPGESGQQPGFRRGVSGSSPARVVGTGTSCTLSQLEVERSHCCRLFITYIWACCVGLFDMTADVCLVIIHLNGIVFEECSEKLLTLSQGVSSPGSHAMARRRFFCMCHRINFSRLQSPRKCILRNNALIDSKLLMILFRHSKSVWPYQFTISHIVNPAVYPLSHSIFYLVLYGKPDGKPARSVYHHDKQQDI